MSNQGPGTSNEKPIATPTRIDTEFTRMIGVDYPIIGAPMFLISYEALAVGVARGGGLGTIPLPNFRTVGELKQTLARIRAETDRPIGVNIHVSGKFPWKEHLALCLNFGVKFFITSLGDPRLILDDVHASGGKVFADVITVEQGLKARDRGVDGLIAVADSAGGHAGRDPLMILVPYPQVQGGSAGDRRRRHQYRRSDGGFHGPRGLCGHYRNTPHCHP
ncbi:MAG: nitronate monooxygenase [Deltaproteobacteria bacterium]|nr:nitronate monooxygenase [Deltaproteobacteria bacterium]